MTEDLGLYLVREVPHKVLHIVTVSGVVDLKVAVVVFEALGDCAVQCEAFTAMLGRRDREPLAFDVEDFLLVLPAVERCLVKVDDRRPVRDVLGQHVGELNPLGLQQSQVVPVRI